MADNSRLEELRRRVEKDPASIAFAQLAEEYRRAGLVEQAVEVCQAGLRIHPGYLSARVTLGRALLELNHLDEAQHELELVLRSAPENLAAIRGLAEILHRRGNLADALTQYRSALSIARNDPDLERTVEELSREVAPRPRAEPANGLSFEQMHQELLAHAPASAAPTTSAATTGQAPVPAADRQVNPDATDGDITAAAPIAPIAPIAPVAPVAPIAPVAPVAPVTPVAPVVAPQYNAAPDATTRRAQHTIAALEQWLDALHVPRTDAGA